MKIRWKLFDLKRTHLWARTASDLQRRSRRYTDHVPQRNSDDGNKVRIP